MNPATAGVYSTADLAVLLRQGHRVLLAQEIARLRRDGLLLRVRRGLYVDRLHGHRAEVLGQRWLAPCYLSTEKALERHGLCQTGILAYTYATSRLLAGRSRAVRRLGGDEFIYRHLARHLFFGYRVEEGIWVAEPEKAALDFLYFHFKGQRSVIAPADIEFSDLNAARYRRYARAYRQRGFLAFARRWLSGRKRGR